MVNEIENRYFLQSECNYTFRFDDVCINSDMNETNKIAELIFSLYPDARVLFGVSPLVHDMTTNLGANNVNISIEKQRVFPKILRAFSDYRNFYNVDIAGIPKMHQKATLAGHGLIHVDHRLLTKEAQEMSILISCSLVKSKVFIPPFNSWNKHTDDVCKENGIELVKFEDGWLSMEHNRFDRNHKLWYLHAREFKTKDVLEWFSK